MAEASDIDHLAYASQAGRALVSIDSDFQDYHRQWATQGKHHTGIFSVNPDLQGEHGIGKIVKALITYWELIEGEAGTLEQDIYDQIIWVR